MRNDPLIFLSAGEASGDHYGAELIARLREVLPHARFTGLGGRAMEAAGQRRTVRAEDVAVMGITEILRHIPKIFRSYRALVRSIHANRPDVAVLIDFPDVNFRLAKHLKRMDVPVLWFVSPQLWAWKRRRLRWVQQRVSTMLTIFPFEEEFYRARGVQAEFVGHPLAEAPVPLLSVASRAEFAQQPFLVPQRPLDMNTLWIALLPGSRRGEILANLPAMVQATALLGSSYEYLIPVAPTVTDDLLMEMNRIIEAVLLQSEAPKPSLHFVRDARTALLHSRAAVVASGTATVQAAVLGTPFVAVYRVSYMTFRLARRLVRYPAELSAEPDEFGNLPVVMPNLIAGHRVVPELLQQQFTPEHVVKELLPLLSDGPERAAQLTGLAEIRQRLLHSSGTASMDRLRDAVLRALGHSPTSSGEVTSASNA